jgi:hypothetical protein
MTAFLKILAAIYASFLEQVRQVNRKYARPELHLTPSMKAGLLVLRIYLLAMICLMGWFLIRQMRGLGHG